MAEWSAARFRVFLFGRRFHNFVGCGVEGCGRFVWLFLICGGCGKFVTAAVEGESLGRLGVSGFSTGSAAPKIYYEF